MRLRETTFETYVKCLSTYLGYLAHVKGLPLTWDTVFDAARVAGVHAVARGAGAALQQRPWADGGDQDDALARVLEHRHASALAALSKTLNLPPRSMPSAFIGCRWRSSTPSPTPVSPKDASRISPTRPHAPLGRSARSDFNGGYPQAARAGATQAAQRAGGAVRQASLQGS